MFERYEFCGGLPTGFEGNPKWRPLGLLSEDGGLLGALELGHGLGSLGDGVFGELTREDKADCRLNLPGAQGLLLGVRDEPSCLAGDPTEGVGDERVQDGHGPLGDADVRVDLLEDAVDVDVVGLPVLAATRSLGCSSSAWHDEVFLLVLVLEVFLNG